MKNVSYVFLLSLLFFSCGNDKKEISITFVEVSSLDAEMTNYPSYFKELSTPFENCELDILLKPISIKRLDISNKNIEINAWWFEKIGDNTVEFSKNWLNQYFKDSLVNSYLKKETIKDFDLDKWITKNKDNLYIYSEDFEDDKYLEIKVFNSTKELHSQIMTDACTKSKIQVLINPKIGNKMSYKANTDVIINPGIETNCLENNNNNKLASDLKDALLKIVDTKLSKSERQAFGDKILNQFFDKENAYVKQKKYKGDQNPTLFNPGEVDMYLYSLTVRQSIFDFCIESIEISKENNKISGLVLTEINNGSVVEN